MGYKHNIEDVLQQGMELIRKEGYHHVGINQILKASGIPKGSFYNFFPSKEAFTKAALEAYGEQSVKMIHRHLRDSELPPLERLKSFYSMLIDANEKDNYKGGCFVNAVSNEIGKNIGTIGAAANDSFQGMIKAVAECVTEGQEAGEITSDYPAIDLAEYLHAGMYGGFSRMKVTASRSYLDRWYKMTFAFIAI